MASPLGAVVVMPHQIAKHYIIALLNKTNQIFRVYVYQTGPSSESPPCTWVALNALQHFKMGFRILKLLHVRTLMDFLVRISDSYFGSKILQCFTLYPSFSVVSCISFNLSSYVRSSNSSTILVYIVCIL